MGGINQASSWMVMMRTLIFISLFAVIASKYLHQELDDTISADPGFSANRAIEVASETELRSPMTTHEFVGRIKRSPKKNKKKKNSSEEDDDESKESNEEMSGDGTNDTED